MSPSFTRSISSRVDLASDERYVLVSVFLSERVTKGPDPRLCPTTIVTFEAVTRQNFVSAPVVQVETNCSNPSVLKEHKNKGHKKGE
jgi:hypothetical protein